MSTQDPSSESKITIKDILDRLEILEEHQTNLENRVQDLENETERNGT